VLKDITLGQYFPGKTLVHNLDPRTKLIFTVLYIVTLFLCANFSAYALVLVFLASCVTVSRIRLKVIMKGMKPLLIIIVLTSILNLFYSKGEPIWEFWIIKISYEGIKNTVFMILRIFMLITGTFLLTYTTSPMQLTDGMESLMNPLKKIKVPVHELSMMMSIALRFIPTLIEETDKIMSAQKARGADFETGNLLQKAKAMLPLLIPLFISAFSRADDLAVAMESRCYHGGVGRTKIKRLVMKKRDFLTLTAGALLLGLTIALNSLGI
jgi:energy-coupling factor transport system permease protein